MTDLQQSQDDLNFIRHALARRSRQPMGMESAYPVWAAYILVGYTLIDFRPMWANGFFLVGGMIAGYISSRIARRSLALFGEFDRDLQRRRGLHWGGGTLLVILTNVAMQLLIPATRGVVGGQICVVLFGMLYFLAGVHFDGNFLWLGPLLIAAGLAVGFIPVYPWTCIGAVIAAALCLPCLVQRRRDEKA